MKIVKSKIVPELDKTYYKVEKIVCDNCNKEIGENKEYLEVAYTQNRYDDELQFKHFCKKCMKNNMYKMFIENDYTDFDRYIFNNNNEKWEEIEDYKLERYGMKEEK